MGSLMQIDDLRPKAGNDLIDLMPPAWLLSSFFFLVWGRVKQHAFATRVPAGYPGICSLLDGLVGLQWDFDVLCY